jgi:hypothetical protein
MRKLERVKETLVPEAETEEVKREVRRRSPLTLVTVQPLRHERVSPREISGGS